MDAQSFRTWLLTAIGKSMETTNFQAHFLQGNNPGTGTNGSTQQWFPCLVQSKVKTTGFGTVLMITGCLAGGRDALYVKDHVNQALHADASQSPIVISGRFSGCTFARCVGGNGHTWVAHIFVDGNDPTNDPTAQARAFETAAGAVANSAVGFTTVGRVQPPAMRGYVIGTHHGVVWQWNWVELTLNGVVTVNQLLGPADWVVL